MVAHAADNAFSKGEHIAFLYFSHTWCSGLSVGSQVIVTPTIFSTAYPPGLRVGLVQGYPCKAYA